MMRGLCDKSFNAAVSARAADKLLLDRTIPLESPKPKTMNGMSSKNPTV